MSIPPRFFPNNPAPKSAADADSQQTPNIGSAASAAAGGTPQQPGSAFRPTAQSPLSAGSGLAPSTSKFSGQQPASGTQPSPTFKPAAHATTTPPLQAARPASAFGSPCRLPPCHRPAGFHISLLLPDQPTKPMQACKLRLSGRREAPRAPSSLLRNQQQPAAAMRQPTQPTSAFRSQAQTVSTFRAASPFRKDLQISDEEFVQLRDLSISNAGIFIAENRKYLVKQAFQQNQGTESQKL